MTRPVILVTAGPSREHLDDVRFLSNASSGAMGIAVAAAAARRGLTAHLALGPVSPEAIEGMPDGVTFHPFLSAEDLDGIARRLWPEVDALVAAAAVCDYRPARRIRGKRKKDAPDWPLTLVRTPDVLAQRARDKEQRVLVGFALEARPRREEALRKLVKKGLDLILLNSTANLGSTAGDFEWLEAGGETRSFTGVLKTELAERLVDYVMETFAGRRGRGPSP
ncbi:MAG: phosphopantothenoylcysteine decarboxylase [Planctomycetota bacterium]